MNGMDDPASESQLIHLKRFGCEPGRLLTRVEAARLIGRLRRGEMPHEIQAELIASGTIPPHAYSSVEPAKQFPKKFTTAFQRQEFWMDTCREPLQMRMHTQEIVELHMKHGCRFNAPNREQAQEILDALDAAMPSWEGGHPELFYQTLELNFPELRRHA